MSFFDFSEAQAAQRLGVHPRTLRHWRNKQLVPYTKTPGGRIGYTETQITEILYQARYRPDETDTGILRN
ncbi:hypothetical protein GCM10009096_10490 [Parasphingorhabdus litoris]|uniref:HTH merR-type domain-containing protein n=1 Tax=Parasphingorhabdus litoris TaxID=394733 RepID=A0ABN1AA58_9SPHN